MLLPSPSALILCSPRLLRGVGYLLLLLGCWGAGGYAADARDDLSTTANIFREAYSDWAAIRNADIARNLGPDNSINVAENRAWKLVEKKFEELKEHRKRLEL